MRVEAGCRWCPQLGWLRAAHHSNRTRSKSRTGPESRRFALANGIVEPRYGRAEVAELADASVSKTDVRKDVRVRLPLSAPQLDVLHLGHQCRRVSRANWTTCVCYRLCYARERTLPCG